MPRLTPCAKLSPQLLALLSLSALTAAATAQSKTWTYGYARPGSEAHIPTIRTTGGAPDLGNSNFALATDRGVGGSPAVLLTGFASAELPFSWGRVWVDIAPPAIFATQLTVLAGTAGVPGAGSGSLPLPIPSAPGLLGVNLRTQWLSFDIGLSGKVLHTEGLGLTVGDPTASQQCASALAYGDHVVCAVSSGSFQSFSFAGQAGDVAWLRAVATGFQARLQVFDPSGNEIANTDPGCTDLTQVSRTLPATGNYTVLVWDGACSGTAQAGSFGLSLHKVDAGPAAELPMGAVLQSSLSARGQATAFKFDAAAGDVLFVRATAGSHQSRVVLFDPTGTGTSYDAGCSDLLELRALAMTTSGTHTLLYMDGACSANGQTGSYSLFVQRLNAPQAVVDFPIGSTATAAIDNIGEVDCYAVALQANDVLYARMVSSGHQPRMTIIDPSGTELHETSAGCGDELALLSNPAPMAGTYLVMVRDSNCSGSRQRGGYGLHLQNVTNPTTTLSAGAGTHTVAVTRRGHVTPIAVIVTNPLLLLTLNATAVQPAFALYDPAGTRIDLVDPGCAGLSTRTYPGIAPGIYLLEIEDGVCSGSGQSGGVTLAIVN